MLGYIYDTFIPISFFLRQCMQASSRKEKKGTINFKDIIIYYHFLGQTNDLRCSCRGHLSYCTNNNDLYLLIN